MSPEGECPCGVVIHATHFYACDGEVRQGAGALACHHKLRRMVGTVAGDAGAGGLGGVVGYLEKQLDPGEPHR